MTSDILLRLDEHFKFIYFFTWYFVTLLFEWFLFFFHRWQITFNSRNFMIELFSRFIYSTWYLLSMIFFFFYFSFSVYFIYFFPFMNRAHQNRSKNRLPLKSFVLSFSSSQLQHHFPRKSFLYFFLIIIYAKL